MGKKEQRIQDNILFLGNRDDVYRLYQAMDVFVLPSRYEGLPVVGVEAQAAGLPCVLSNKMTKETKMTENVEFLSLDSGHWEWEKKIREIDKIATDRDITVSYNAAFPLKSKAVWCLNFIWKQQG